MAYVYRHIRLDKNEVFYIGIGNDDTFKRANEFNTGRNKYWNNIKNKSEIKVEILCEDVSWEDACDLECLLIEIYGRKDLKSGNLVNMTDGGEGATGRIMSDETKDKISKSNTGKKLSDKQKQSISDSQKGRVLTEEHKKNISDGNKGKRKTKEHAENIRRSKKGIVCWSCIEAAKVRNTGSTQTKETIEKRILKLKGRKNNENTIDIMRQSAIDTGKCRSIYCENNGEIYTSIAEATRLLKVNNIAGVCQGKFKQTKGFIFKYLDERIEILEGGKNGI